MALWWSIFDHLDDRFLTNDGIFLSCTLCTSVLPSQQVLRGTFPEFDRSSSCHRELYLVYWSRGLNPLACHTSCQALSTRTSHWSLAFHQPIQTFDRRAVLSRKYLCEKGGQIIREQTHWSYRSGLLVYLLIHSTLVHLVLACRAASKQFLSFYRSKLIDCSRSLLLRRVRIDLSSPTLRGRLLD